MDRLVRPLTLALALTALAVGAWPGVPRAWAQAGVWTTVPVPGTSALAVAEGDSGTILIAGNVGAFRYDGIRMRRLPIFSPNADSLNGQAVLRATNGDTWFGTGNHGVFRLAPDGTVSQYRRAEGVGNSSDDDILCLAEGPGGAIWAGTRQGGLSRFDGAAWTTFTTDQGLPTNLISDVAVDPRDGSIWAACGAGSGQPGGLVHIVGGTVTLHQGLTLDFGNQNLFAVVVTAAGRVWVGYAAGMAELVGGAFVEYGTGSTTGVTTLAEGRHGEFWFGTGNKGIGRFDNATLTIFASGPPSNDVRTVFIDPAGVLWVGTSAGLGRFEGSAWSSYSRTYGLPGSSGVYSTVRDTRAVARGDSIDVQGSTWFGLNPTFVGLNQLNLARRASGRILAFGTSNGLPPGAIRALAPADSGQVWLGTVSNVAGGVARVDQAGQVRRRLGTAEGLPSVSIFAVRGTGATGVWIGSALGVAYIENDAAPPRLLPVGAGRVPDASVRGLDLDAQGRLWVATGENVLGGDSRLTAGAVRFDSADSSYTYLNVASGLPTNALTSVTVFQNGDVWFGSTAGAIRLRGGVLPGAIDVYRVADGLPAAQVTDVVEGENGEAWVATVGGLALYDGANWTSFNVSDGLAGGQVVALHADSLGVIAAVAGDGVSLFHPDRTPPRADIVTAPPAATGSSAVQFGIRGGDLDSGTRGLKLAYQMDGGTPSPFLEDVNAAAFPGLLDGEHEFKLWAKDRGLTVSAEPEVWRFTVDATAPRPIVEQPTFNSIVRDTVEVTGSVADPRFAQYTIEIRPEGRQLWDTLLVSTTPPPPGEPLYLWDTTAQLDGVWELRVGSSDSLGLIGYVQVTTIVDNLAPSASVTAPAKVDHVQGGHVFTTNGEVELAVPPNAWPADQIVRIDPVPPLVTLPAPYAGATWAAGWLVRADDMTLDKPATLTIRPPVGLDFGMPVSVARIDVAGTDTTLVPVGGLKSDPDGRTISTTVSQLGAFAVLYGVAVAGEGFEGAHALDCQPRVLSPNGGGFDTKMTISFDVGGAKSGAVKIYDRAGRLVKEIVESGAFSPGRNVVFWDGTDGNGRVVPSGLYTVAVRFDDQTAVASVVVANR